MSNDQDILKKLAAEMKRQKQLVRTMDRDMKNKFKKHEALVTATLNNQKASKNQDEWDKKKWDAFMMLFKSKYEHNPFCSLSKLCNNGTMLFVSDERVLYTHVQELLVCLCSFGRYVHINTGTHGTEDGSTMFWVTNSTLEWIKASKENTKEWVNGAQTFMNEDLKTIQQTTKLLQKASISIRFVDSDIFPIYPKYCDIINAWCYSGKTPRCPESLYRELLFKLQYQEGKTKDKLADELSDVMVAMIPKLKMDNAFCVIMDALKLIGVSEECVRHLTSVFMKSWMEVYPTDMVSKVDKIDINDKRWDKKLLLQVFTFIVDFMGEFYKGNAQKWLKANLNPTLGLKDDAQTSQGKTSGKKRRPKRSMLKSNAKQKSINLENSNSNETVSNAKKPNKEEYEKELKRLKTLETFDEVNEEDNRNDYCKNLIIEVIQAGHLTHIKKGQSQYKNQNKSKYSLPVKITQTKNQGVTRFWIGRAHDNIRNDRQPFVPVTDDGHLSRYHMRVTYDAEMQAYWIQDLLTQFPVYMVVSHKEPMVLRQGMMIKGGMQRQDGSTTVITIDKLSIEDEDFRDNTVSNDRLQQFFMSGCCKVNQYNKHMSKPYLRVVIDNDKHETCFQCETDEDNDTWLVVSTGLKPKQLKEAGISIDYFKQMKKSGRIVMMPNNAPGYWGDIKYEKDTGWYLQATQWGERHQSCLKIMLKNKGQMRQYDSGQSESDPILIQDGMKFGVIDSFSFQCHTETVLKTSQDQSNFGNVSGGGGDYDNYNNNNDDEELI